MSTTTTMKETPLLFSEPMVRAILAGLKTQTRRVMKNPPAYPGTTKFCFELHPFAPSTFVGTPAEGIRIAPENKVWVYEDWCGNIVGVYGDCKFGKVGDRLWVKETFRNDGETIVYRAGGKLDVAPIEINTGIVPESESWRPSIFMPRWASRITLEITEIRVERLNDISETDAIEEGAHQKIWITSPMSAGAYNARGERGTHREGYKEIWEEINGTGSWAKNPWVWAITFKRL